MGNKVGNFFKEVAKTAAKAATSFVLGKVPILGTPLANKLNSMYKAGGQVKPFAEGGVVFAKPTQAVNTAAQLIAVIKKLPEEAAKAGISVEDVKKAVAEQKEGQAVVDAKRRGGRKKESSGDVVQLMRDKSESPKRKHKKKHSKNSKKAVPEELNEAYARGGIVHSGLVPSIF
jgi:hypothetical protein